MQDKHDAGQEKTRPDVTGRYYDLKSSALDDLVNARRGKSRQYSMEELSKYRRGKHFHFPDWLKVVFVKAWFAGAVCFFFLWGLGLYIHSTIDMLFVLGIALGFSTDLLANNVIRFIEKTPGANDRWMMFPKKNYISLVLNVLYSFAVLFCVYTTYTQVNEAIVRLNEQPDTVPLGVEPLLFGILCMLFDLLFVWIKQTFLRVVRDARDKVEGKK